jgi:drug/metabolite transporter (DMT)-like permease
MGVWLAGPVARRGGAWLPHRTPAFQVLRGAAAADQSSLWLLCLQHLPVAEFTAIVMLTPVMVTLLAAWLLRERRRGCAGRWWWAASPAR